MFKRNILSIYFIAGYPNIDNLNIILSTLEKCGIDLIEIGIPYSDTLADGNTIVKFSKKALYSGMNTYILFNIFKKQIYKFNIPLILVGYYNIFIKFGDDLFLKQCVEAGIYFVLLHDLPLQYYIDRYKILFKRYKLCLILLVCTNTYYDRLIQLSKYTNVFLYLVSSMSTTGRIFHYGTQQLFFFKLINDLNIKKVIGFGIYNNNSFKLSCNYADGVIIGSAFIKALNKKTIEYNIVSFIQIIN